MMHLKRISALCLFSIACSFGLRAENTVEGYVRTISDEIVTIADESDLDDGETVVSNIVLKAMGGIRFTKSIRIEKHYEFEGDGVIEIDEGVEIEDPGTKDNGNNGNRKSLFAAALGHTFYKRGKGVLLAGRPDPRPLRGTLRIVVEEGEIQNRDKDFFGGHDAVLDNVTIEIREGAVYNYPSFGSVGDLILTGGTFKNTLANPNNEGRWRSSIFQRGITAQPCETPSVVSCLDLASTKAGGTNTLWDLVMTVESGAELVMDTELQDGLNHESNGRSPGRVIKRGAGQLDLLHPARWSGGTVLESGTVRLGARNALGEPVTIAGNVTIEAPAGVTVTIGELDLTNSLSSATLTLVGEGAFVLPAAIPGLSVDDQTTKSRTNPVVGTGLMLSGGTTVVDVPEEEEVVITAIDLNGGSLAAYSDILKVGKGTLILPSGISDRYRNLTVHEGFVAIQDETSFGSGIVKVSDETETETGRTDGGGLRFLTSFTQSRQIICKGKAHLDIPEDITFTMRDEFFMYKDTTLTKTGGGLWKMDTNFNNKDKNGGSKWIIDEGVLETPWTRGGLLDAFVEGGKNTFKNKPGLKIEIHEKGVLRSAVSNQRYVLGDVTLRGGTIDAWYDQFAADTGTYENINKWKGIGFNGTVTVQASTNGQPSRVCARTVSAGHCKFETVFDVQRDATLEIEGLLNPGRSDAWEVMTTNLVTKKGAGTLILKNGMGIVGTFQIQDGTVEVGEGATIADRTTLRVSKNAKLVLADQARLAAMVEPSADGIRIDVPENASAVFIRPETNVEDVTSYPIVKGGAGTLWIGGSLTNGAAIQVESGKVQFKDGPIRSRVAVWMDANDAETVQRGEDGLVSSVINKGFAGGAFTVNTAGSATAPMRTEKSINGCSTLSFNGDNKQALVLRSYTNTVSPRSINIYAVLRINKWRDWDGAFSLSSDTAEKEDNNYIGSVHVEQTNAKTDNVYDYKQHVFTGDGSARAGYLYTADPGEPYLQAIRAATNGWAVSWEKYNAAENGVTQWAASNTKLPPFDINMVNIGSRLAKMGMTQNHWSGEIGEFIVTTMPLSEDEEKELLEYLRKKWFNRGEGSATAPAWLVGNACDPVSDKTTTLALADGAGVHVATTAPVQLGALTTAGTTDWSRAWAGGASDVFQMFSVDGDVTLENMTLAAEPFPEPKSLILDWTGTWQGACAWKLLTDRSLCVVRTEQNCRIDGIGFFLIIR